MHSLKNVTYRNAEHSMIRYWLYWNIIKIDVYYDYSDIAMHYSIMKDTTNAILYHKKHLEELKRELSQIIPIMSAILKP